MSAAPRSVADIVGADIAVIGTAGAVRGKAVVGSLVTRVVALRPAAARVAGMDGARTSTASVGTIAVKTIIAGRSGVGMSAASGAIADIVGADIAIIGAGGAVSDIAIIRGFVTDVVADRPAAAGVSVMH